MIDETELRLKAENARLRAALEKAVVHVRALGNMVIDRDPYTGQGVTDDQRHNQRVLNDLLAECDAALNEEPEQPRPLTGPGAIPLSQMTHDEMRKVYPRE